MSTSPPLEVVARTRFRIDADGVDLHGWTCGAGPPVLLLHAGRENCDVWEPIAPTIAMNHRRRCVAIDQRGHGASGGVGNRLAEFGDDVARMLERLGSDVVVVGASLGGMAAVHALRHRHVASVVRRIVLVDVVPAPDPSRVRPFLAARGLDRDDDGLIDDILRSGSELHRRLAEAQVSVTLVRATDSPLSDRDVERLARSLHDLAVTTVESDHLVARHAPDDLAAAIGEAIDATLRAPSATVTGQR